MQGEQRENPCGRNHTELDLEHHLHTSGDGELTTPAAAPLLVLMPRMSVLSDSIESTSIVLPPPPGLPLWEAGHKFASFHMIIYFYRLHIGVRMHLLLSA